MSSSEANYIINMVLRIHILSLRISFIAGSAALHLRGTKPQSTLRRWPVACSMLVIS